MNPHTIVFIGGVHGTGKGVLCKRLCSALKWEHLIASELLKWKEYSDASANKKVKNIPETQTRFINGLNRACAEGGSFLLDGHYTLLDNEYKVTRIQLEIFEAINPMAMLLKTEQSEIVWKRLKKRDGHVYPKELINRMLNEEYKYSCELAKHFGIPHLEIASENDEEIISKIAQLL